MTVNPVELIRKKREGGVLSEEELRFLINGYVAGAIPDYQMSAFLMACYFRGMEKEETATFTQLMLRSGEIVDLSDVHGLKVDKHSTGGVGDKVSLILAPLVAACGVPVPMISGRGLGHTGGTLDKLESIPGFRTNLSIDEYKKVIKSIGVVMIGQTKDIAPADKKMYALRDVTGTVECIPLIAGSIMSKKLAEGIDALVLDVKTGRGAFMSTYDQSVKLASTLVELGTQFGKETLAFITDMSQPLGVAIGNWLEVVESVECLQGKRGNGDQSADLMEVTFVLAGAMLMAGKKAATIREGIGKAKEALANGAAYRKFLALVKAQGGNADVFDELERAPVPRHSIEVKSGDEGYLESVDPLELGLTGILLGAGRQKVDDPIDPKAGIVLKKKVGDRVDIGDTLAIFYSDRDDSIQESKRRIQKAFRVKPSAPPRPVLVRTIIDANGVRPWTEGS